MQGKRACVIGGGGFLGRHLVEKLLERSCQVTVFDLRCEYSDDRIKVVTGDLCDKQVLLPVLSGQDVVFHCATPSPLSQNRDLFVKVNYDGTKVILEACREAKVKCLVLTSSASVVYEGVDIVAATERMPYAETPMDYYTETKILQEQVVLSANGSDFRTVAIRPHGIFGPRDPHLVPTTIRMAAAGKTKFIIGNGENLVDFTYVENVVHGHILAAEALLAGKPVDGKIMAWRRPGDKPLSEAMEAYHITNDEPVFFWGFLSSIITGLGYGKPCFHLPFTLIYYVALLLDFICMLIRPILDIRPNFTPMTVTLASTHHYYSCDRAKKELGYQPLVSVKEGVQRTLDSFRHLHKNHG